MSRVDDIEQANRVIAAQEILLRKALDDLVVLSANLSSTQARCGVLLEECRRLRRERGTYPPRSPHRDSAGNPVSCEAAERHIDRLTDDLLAASREGT